MHVIILFILFIIIYYSPLSSPRLSSFSILSPLLTPSPFYLLPASLSPTYCLPLLLPFTFHLPSSILAFIPLLTSVAPPPYLVLYTPNIISSYFVSSPAGASSIIACVWPSSTPDGIYALGLGLEQPYVLALYIWIYCIVWWFIQDVTKVLLYKLIIKYNIFKYNSTGKLVLPESTLEYIRNNREKDMELGSKPGGH